MLTSNEGADLCSIPGIDAEYGHPYWVLADPEGRRNKTIMGASPGGGGRAEWGPLHESESAHRRHAPAGAARAVAQEHLVGCQKAVPMINGDLALVGSGTEDGAARGAAGVSRVTPG